jgi:hypothetical protein
MHGPSQRVILHWHSNNAVPQLRWLVKKMLPETGVGLLSGRSSSGKTFVALNLAQCIATDKLFAGRQIKRKGGTLFLAAEAAGDIPDRLLGLGGPPLPFAWVDDVPTISEPDALKRLVEIAREAEAEMCKRFALPLALIIVDTLAAAAGFKDENDSANVQAVMNVLHQFALATGALVLVVDHFGKNDKGGTRGSSAKEASADAVLALAAPDDSSAQHTMTIRKLRSGIKGTEFGFWLREVKLGDDGDGEPITTCVVEFSSGPVNSRKATWVKLEDLKRALDQALGLQCQKLPPFGQGAPSVDATPLKLVREEFYKAYACKGDYAQQQETRRKAFNRQLDRGRTQGLIGTREVGGETYIWMVPTQGANSDPP